MVQASTWAHHRGSRTGKNIAGMGGKELMTGSLPALCVCWGDRVEPPQFEGPHPEPPGAEGHCQISFETGRIQSIFIIPYHSSE